MVGYKVKGFYFIQSILYVKFIDYLQLHTICHGSVSKNTKLVYGLFVLDYISRYSPFTGLLKMIGKRKID